MAKEKHDLKYWEKKLEAARIWRQRFGWEYQWDDSLKYWRDEAWDRKRDLPYNIGQSLGMAQLPALYYNNPYIIVSTENQKLTEHCLIVESVLNTLVYGMNVQDEFEEMTLDAFTMGRGIGQIGYIKGFIAPESFEQALRETHIFSRSISSTQTHDMRVRDNAAWFRRIDPEDALIPYGVRRLEEAPWFTIRHRRRVEDLKNDPRISVSNKELERFKSAVKSEDSTELYDSEIMREGSVEHDYLEYWEIWCFQDGTVGAMIPGYDKWLSKPTEEGDAELLRFGLPFESFGFIPDTRRFWWEPELLAMEPQLLEMSATRKQAQEHRKVSVLKILMESDLLEPDEFEKLLQGTVGGIVKVNPSSKDIKGRIADIKGYIPPELLQWHREIRDDIRERIGFSRMDLGAEMPTSHRTAAEVRQVSAKSDSRLQWKRKQIARSFTSMVRKLLMIIFENWTGQQVVPIVGKDMSIYYVEFEPQELASEYSLRVDVESMRPKSRDERVAQLASLLNMTANMPVNHGYLLQLLMRNFEWINVAKVLPQAQGGPMNPAQFAQTQSGMPQQKIQSGQQQAIKTLGEMAGT